MIYHPKTILVVTGASKGFGKVLSTIFCNEFIKSQIVLSQQSSLFALQQQHPGKIITTTTTDMMRISETINNHNNNNNCPIILNVYLLARSMDGLMKTNDGIIQDINEMIIQHFPRNDDGYNANNMSTSSLLNTTTRTATTQQSSSSSDDDNNVTSLSLSSTNTVTIILKTNSSSTTLKDHHHNTTTTTTTNNKNENDDNNDIVNHHHNDEKVSLLKDKDDDNVIFNTTLAKIHIHCISTNLSNLLTLDETINQLWDHIMTTSTMNDHYHATNNNNKNIVNQNHDASTATSNNHNAGWRLILIHNAASLGYIGPVVKEETHNDNDNNTNQHSNYNDYMKLSLNDMKQTIDFNITSTLWFTTKITQYLMQQQSNDDRRKQNMIHHADIVNISSLAALYPFPTMAIYSTCKAARNMYHQSLAMEMMMNKDNDNNDIASNNDHHDDYHKNDATNTTSSTLSTPNQYYPMIRYLNYAPGPLDDTDMTKQLLYHRKQLHKMVYPNEYVTVQKSAQKLVRILLLSKYESGTHIDYYDNDPF